jgi:transcription elongation factor Elf1
MSKVFTCPHCHAQNFATQARLRLAQAVALTCWKCGRGIKKPKVIPAKNKDKALKNKGK